MSSSSVARRGGGLIVAASIGAVETLKDQLGVCRWNYAFKSIHQTAKTTLVQSYSSYSSNGSGNINSKVMMIRADEEKIKRTEQSLHKVMGLSCWGPNTVRF